MPEENKRKIVDFRDMKIDNLLPVDTLEVGAEVRGRAKMNANGKLVRKIVYQIIINNLETAV